MFTIVLEKCNDGFKPRYYATCVWFDNTGRMFANYDNEICYGGSGMGNDPDTAIDRLVSDYTAIGEYRIIGREEYDRLLEEREQENG